MQTITGPAAGVTLSGNESSRVLEIESNVTAMISGLTISGGATTANGGGLSNAGTVTLSDCTISGNSAFAGGGIYNTGTANFSDSTISGNVGAGSAGGLLNQGTANLTDCTISGNSASGANGGTGGGADGLGSTGSGSGGGIFNNGTTNLTTCTISGDSATYGGGLFNYGQATLTACTISGNSASKNGGGIFAYSYISPTSATLTDTIIAANSGDLAATAIGIGADASITGSYNLIGTTGAGIFQNGNNFNIVLTSLDSLGLDPLGNFSGPTGTMALLPGSVAIGAGTAVSGVTTDQRGQPLDSPMPDIGAFQTHGYTFTALGGSTPQSALPTGVAFTDPLAINVAAINANDPVAGGIVSFTANPASDGASASLSSPTATIGSSGIAQVSATANSIGGNYTVAASDTGATTIDFMLTNTLPLMFSGITNQTITYGTSSVTFTGTLADGTQVPSGEDVSVSLNGGARSSP